MMRAELKSKWFFVVASVDRHCLEAHPPRVLNAEMSKPADAVNGNQLSRACARISQRVVDRDTRAHEWSCFLRRQFVWDGCKNSRRRDHVLSVPSVEIDAGYLAIDTHREVPAPAWFADETVSAMPAHADALSGRPSGNVVADWIDASSYFVTRHARILEPRPQTFLDKSLAVANAASIYLHANLSRSGLWYVALD